MRAQIRHFGHPSHENAGGWKIVSSWAPFSAGGFYGSLQRFSGVRRFVVAKMGRPALPREVRVAFWDGVRAGLGVEAAAGAAGVSRHVAWKWMRAAGGVKQNGPAGVSGRFLQGWEREEIAVGLAAGLGCRAIAARLAPGRSASTVSREVRRNSVRGAYRAHLAAREARERARRPKAAKLAVNAELRAWAEEKLGLTWSPEEISARLRLDFPGRAEMRVSAETVYQSLYVQGRGALRRELAAHLRTGRELRRPRRAAGERRGKIPGMVNISQRPAEAADRAVPGHWEGDMIEGRAGKSQLGTLVERTTRFTMLVPLPGGRSAAAMAAALTPVIAGLPGALRRSLTWDQGKEMHLHHRIAVAADCEIFFCDPHSPWQRPSNENTNGLLRQYFPKGSDLSVHSPRHLQAVADELNGRPRKVLGWKTPAEAMAEFPDSQAA
jgi:transposase, IS30 family